MPFSCTEHHLFSQTLDHCPRCWEIKHDKEKRQWLQVTPTQSDNEHSNSLGTLELTEAAPLLDQFTALRSTYAGIYSELLNSGQQSTAENSEERTAQQYATVVASIASLQQAALEFHMLVNIAKQRHNNWLRAKKNSTT